ncbi:hypothetical protein CapIbe_013557 [Capra ibex]
MSMEPAGRRRPASLLSHPRALSGPRGSGRPEGEWPECEIRKGVLALRQHDTPVNLPTSEGHFQNRIRL